MLISLAGADPFMLNEAARDIIRTLQSQHGADVPITRVDCTDPDAAEHLDRPLKYPSFFYSHHIILATNAGHPILAMAAEQHRIANIPDITLIAIHNADHPEHDAESAKTLHSLATQHQDIQPLSPEERIRWGQQFCTEQGCEGSRAALSILFDRVGGDLRAASHELEKVCAYVRHGAITPDVVIMLVRPRYERDEWGLSNAIAAYDKRGIMTSLWKRVMEGAPEQLLVGSLAAGIRTALMVADLRSRGMAPGAIAKTSGLHPFVVAKTLRGAAAARIESLREAHLALARLDRLAKDGLAQSADALFSVMLRL
ncbi:MAG: DNA polymerase III subunit delta [Candidatus Yanofskybacteria bacterium]|nr:DNA polymerase III subunit delta [Candidatus Yanofskybacteria bacterium]